VTTIHLDLIHEGVPIDRITFYDGDGDAWIEVDEDGGASWCGDMPLRSGKYTIQVSDE
jgi:hypothetical protein